MSTARQCRENEKHATGTDRFPSSVSCYWKATSFHPTNGPTTNHIGQHRRNTNHRVNAKKPRQQNKDSIRRIDGSEKEA